MIRHKITKEQFYISTLYHFRNLPIRDIYLHPFLTFPHRLAQGRRFPKQKTIRWFENVPKANEIPVLKTNNRLRYIYRIYSFVCKNRNREQVEAVKPFFRQGSLRKSTFRAASQANILLFYPRKTKITLDVVSASTTSGMVPICFGNRAIVLVHLRHRTSVFLLQPFHHDSYSVFSEFFGLYVCKVLYANITISVDNKINFSFSC